MKSFLILISTFFAFSSGVFAMSGEDWRGEYELNNGMKITRTTTGIIIKADSLNMTLPKYVFGKGSKLNTYVATADGCLSPALTKEKFLIEVSKLGTVTKTTF